MPSGRGLWLDKSTHHPSMNMGKLELPWPQGDVLLAYKQKHCRDSGGSSACWG